MITNITKEKDMIKSLDASECNGAIIFFSENYEKIPESYHWNVNYVKINGSFIQALKQMKAELQENEICEFFIEPNNVGLYLMYEILNNEDNYCVYIFENNEFKLLPPRKNKLDSHEILILKTLVGNQYNTAEIIRKYWITKTLVYDGLKRLQDMGLIVKSNRKFFALRKRNNILFSFKSFNMNTHPPLKKKPSKYMILGHQNSTNFECMDQKILQNYQKSKIFDAAKTPFLQATFCSPKNRKFFDGLAQNRNFRKSWIFDVCEFSIRNRENFIFACPKIL